MIKYFLWIVFAVGTLQNSMAQFSQIFESKTLRLDYYHCGKADSENFYFGGLKQGKVEFKGTTWTAESVTEISEGQRVIIIEKDSFKLIVEPKK